MKLSILTPTYNRAELLKRAYLSLKNQTNLNFEWIVVDDGSTDKTKEVVDKFVKEQTKFKILYFAQENLGKCAAINLGVQNISGEYCLILDSDDYLTDDAVETVYGWIKDIDGISNMAGVSGLRGWSNKDGAIGGHIKKEFIDCTNIERKKYGLLGDKAEIYKTEILRKYPFPKFENENFLSEACVWDLIANDGYKIRWYNKIIYKCEYLEGGLTKGINNEMLLKNFQGYTYYVKLYYSTHRGLSGLNLIGKYCSVAKLKKLKNKQIRKNLNISAFKCFMGKFVHLMNKSLKSLKKS